MKVVHFGAGNIGRGAIPEIFFPICTKLVFVDPNQEIVDKLNSIHSYKIKNKKNLNITNYCAININDVEKIAKEIQDADIISTSCGFDNLKSIAFILDEVANVINKPINVICFENNIRPSSYLASLVKNNKNYFFIDCTIDRVIPKQEFSKNNLDIIAEDYLDVVVEKKNILNLNFFANCKIVENLDNFISLKLFAVNGLHFVIAILTYNKGIEFIYQGLANKEILDKVVFYCKYLKLFLVRKYCFDENYIEKYLDNNIKRFSSNLIKDECARVARNSILKLSFENRVTPVFKFFIDNKAKIELEDFVQLKNILTQLYSYNNPNDPDSVKIQNFIKNNGYSKTILHYSNITF